MTSQSTEEEAVAVAQEIVSHNEDELKRELINEGVYHFIVEAGFHTQAISDSAADRLVKIVTENGITGLEEFVADKTD